MLTDTIETVLNNKGNQIYSVSPDQFAIDGIALMAEKNVASVVVVSAGRPVGIVSAKDYAKRVALEGKSSENTRIRAIMTSPLITVTLDTTVSQAMALMASKRIRHLPVVDRDRLVGIVALGDLARSIIAEQALAIDQLQDYIGQQYPG
jgi:CBS domain-containing protein